LVLVLVPQPYSLCRSIAFHAAMMFSVLWHCTLCCGNACHAATLFLVLRQCSSCGGKARCTTAKLFVAQQSSSCHGKSCHATAKLFMPWQQNDAVVLSGIILRVVARVAARNEHLCTKNNTAAFCVMQCCYSLCCSQVHLAVASFFVTWQETMCHSILHHHSSLRSKKQCAAAFHGIVHHGASCRHIVCCAVAMSWCYRKEGAKNNQPVQHWPLWWCRSGGCYGLVGFFCGGCCVFLSGENNQPFWQPWQSLWLMVFWGFAFFCSGLAHSSVVAFCGTFLCISAVLCAMVLHFVPVCSCLCRSDFFVLWQFFCAVATFLCCSDFFVPR